MIARFSTEELEEMARKAKVASQMLLKAPAAPVLIEDEEDTCSGLVFPRKRKAPVIPTENSPSRGRVTSNHASPPRAQPPSPITMSNFERGTESSRRKGLWDPSLDIASHLESALILPEDEERLMVHDGHCTVPYPG